ncbi:MAG: Ferritin [Chloroflexi bacterium ADurb.Bin325]|nr:MAG: Ferritin [Chloroflexi bacterium ADurb.Bin325]
MLSNTLLTALNDQIKHELYSAYFYLSMSAYCDAHHMPGAASWLKVQAQEEQAHALKFFAYIQERGAAVTLQAIDQPPTTFGSLLEIFEQVQKHEAFVTSLINGLYELALKENDYPTQIMLQWFISEQVEEENTSAQIVDMLRMVGPQGQALFMADAQLGRRAQG